MLLLNTSPREVSRSSSFPTLPPRGADHQSFDSQVSSTGSSPFFSFRVRPSLCSSVCFFRFLSAASLWSSFVIEPLTTDTPTPTPTLKFWFAGDTGYSALPATAASADHTVDLTRPVCPAFKEIGERWGGFDLALIPIGAYEPRSVCGFSSALLGSRPDDADAAPSVCLRQILHVPHPL